MTFTEKLVHYRTKTETPIHVMSALFGVSQPTYRKIEGNPVFVPSQELIDRLETETQVASYIWTNEEADLPELEPKSRVRGRKPKVVSPNALLINRQRINRLQQIIRENYDNNQRNFAAGCMLDETRLSKLLSGKIELTDRELQRVSRHTGISYDWLRTGTGPMLERERVVEVAAPDPHNGSQLGDYLKSRGYSWTFLQQAMGLASLSSVVGPKGYNSRQEIRPQTKQRIADALRVAVSDIWPPAHGEMRPYFKEEYPTIEIPYLPETARAGLDIERYFEQPPKTVTIRLDIIPENLRHRRWWQIQVNGDSMEPLLIHGDDVNGYEQTYDEWFSINNRVVIVSYANHVVIKRIKKNTLRDEGGLWLHSENPVAETFFVKLDDIRMIWLVENRTGKIR